MGSDDAEVSLVSYELSLDLLRWRHRDRRHDEPHSSLLNLMLTGEQRLEEIRAGRQEEPALGPRPSGTFDERGEEVQGHAKLITFSSTRQYCHELG